MIHLRPALVFPARAKIRGIAKQKRISGEYSPLYREDIGSLGRVTAVIVVGAESSNLAASSAVITLLLGDVTQRSAPDTSATRATLSGPSLIFLPRVLQLTSLLVAARTATARSGAPIHACRAIARRSAESGAQKVAATTQMRRHGLLV